MQETQQEMQCPGGGSEAEEFLENRPQETRENRLTAVEMGNLWFSYNHEALSYHLFVYFSKHMEDPVIEPVLTSLIEVSGGAVSRLESIFTKGEIPIPRGINTEDFNLDAPRLFSDNLFVSLLRMMVGAGLQFYVVAYGDSSRPDIREYFRDSVDRLLMHTRQSLELTQAKEIPLPPPHIPVPEQVDFVKKQNFMAGFLVKKRPLTALEINDIFFNAQANALGKALMLGFSQVVQSAEIKRFLVKGKNLANKFFTDLNKTLQNENITVSPSLDGEVTDSTEPSFSDRMMLFYATFMNSLGLQHYGRALAMNQRRDLSAMFAKMIVETGVLANEGAKLLIDRGWLEQPPLAPDREALIEQDSPAPDKQLH